MRFLFPTAVILLCLATAAGRAAEPPSFTKTGKSLLTEYCGRCHNAKKQEGGINLVSFPDDASALAKRKLWQHARKRVAAGEMPPEDARQPSPADKARLLKWLADTGEYLDCDPAHRDPGPPLLRRLTHTEYGRTISDLFGVYLDPRNDLGLPSEEASDGRFDNLAAILQISRRSWKSTSPRRTRSPTRFL